MPSLAPKKDFIGLEGRVHLAAGGEPPQLETVKQALERFVGDKSGGSGGRARFFDVSQEARERLGRMMQVPGLGYRFPGELFRCNQSGLLVAALGGRRQCGHQ